MGVNFVNVILSCELPLWPETSLEDFLVFLYVHGEFCHSGHVHPHDFCMYRQFLAEEKLSM
jgi:hypothetical protein